MVSVKAISIACLAATLVAAPVSSASAHRYFFHHGGHGGPVLGLFGAVAALAVAPVVILSDIASAPRYERRDYDDQAGNDYYNQKRAYKESAPNYGGAYAGPGYQGGYDRRTTYGAPAGNYPPQQAYSAPPQNYGPPQGYAAPPPNYGPGYASQGYYAPQRGYAPQGYYGAPQGYAPPQGYSAPPPAYNYPAPGQ